MRKRIGFVFMLGLLIGYPFELSSQAMSEEEKKLIQEYLEKNNPNGTIAVPSPAVREKYKTPSIYEPPASADSGMPQAGSKPSERGLETPAQ